MRVSVVKEDYWKVQISQGKRILDQLNFLHKDDADRFAADMKRDRKEKE